MLTFCRAAPIAPIEFLMSWIDYTLSIVVIVQFVEIL